ncbi:MAG: SDR family NAD(P)-dependent oxidoreductase [Planctomycetota bacterium]
MTSHLGTRPTNRPVAITGASSALSRAIAMRLAKRGHALALTARDPAELEATATDIAVRTGVNVAAVPADLADEAAADTLFARLDEASHRELGAGITGLVIAHSGTPDQEHDIADPASARRVYEHTLVTPALLLNAATLHFERVGEARDRPFIVVIGSVAGDRGRPANSVYGSAKAGLAALTQGARDRLGPQGVSVVLVKPGWIDTRSTFAIDKGRALIASPDTVARDIAKAIDRRSPVVYTPWFWRWILALVRIVPAKSVRRDLAESDSTSEADRQAARASLLAEVRGHACNTIERNP